MPPLQYKGYKQSSGGGLLEAGIGDKGAKEVIASACAHAQLDVAT